MFGSSNQTIETIKGFNATGIDLMVCNAIITLAQLVTLFLLAKCFRPIVCYNIYTISTELVDRANNCLFPGPSAIAAKTKRRPDSSLPELPTTFEELPGPSINLNKIPSYEAIPAPPTLPPRRGARSSSEEKDWAAAGYCMPPRAPKDRLPYTAQDFVDHPIPFAKKLPGKIRPIEFFGDLPIPKTYINVSPPPPKTTILNKGGIIVDPKKSKITSGIVEPIPQYSKPKKRVRFDTSRVLGTTVATQTEVVEDAPKPFTNIFPPKKGGYIDLPQLVPSSKLTEVVVPTRIGTPLPQRVIYFKPPQLVAPPNSDCCITIDVDIENPM